MNLPNPKKWATVYATNSFISVNTCSGFRSSARDPQGKELFFGLDVSDEQLGSGVLQALSANRFLAPEEVRAFFNPNMIESRYENWVELLTGKFGYRTRYDLFRDMKHCTIEHVDGYITIAPTNHEEPEAWSGDGIDSSDYETLADDASEAQLGQALKRSIGKCI